MPKIRLDVWFGDGKHDTVAGSIDWIEDYLTAVAESGRAENITSHAFSAA